MVWFLDNDFYLGLKKEILQIRFKLRSIFDFRLITFHFDLLILGNLTSKEIVHHKNGRPLTTFYGMFRLSVGYKSLRN